MTNQHRSRELPSAFSLKPHIVRYADRMWCRPDLPRMLAAPIYLFPDSVSFDSDDLGCLSRALMRKPFSLPHNAVFFEVAHTPRPGDRVVAYAEEDDGQVEACLFQYVASRGRWTNAICLARFQRAGYDEFVFDGAKLSDEDAAAYANVLGGVVGRALALLAMRCPLQSHVVPSLRRRGVARHVGSGWIYRVAEIDPAKVQMAAVRLDGTHASPRWHMRRGHWRQLADGRRVFVRECEVGDPSRGGVIKDYQVQVGEAA